MIFATHDLVAGKLEGVSEPAVVLTPRAEGMETDDGLPTASKVAQPKGGAENQKLDDLAVARNFWNCSDFKQSINNLKKDEK